MRSMSIGSRLLVVLFFSMDKLTITVLVSATGAAALLSFLQTKKGKTFATAYANHSALNLGQAARDVRYFYEHPDADKIAPHGTPLHVASSVASRIPSLASNLYYGALPPQLHHSAEELSGEGDTLLLKDRFLQGYDPWSYSKRS